MQAETLNLKALACMFLDWRGCAEHRSLLPVTACLPRRARLMATYGLAVGASVSESGKVGLLHSCPLRHSATLPGRHAAADDGGRG